jgi:hypothetical protein
VGVLQVAFNTFTARATVHFFACGPTPAGIITAGSTLVATDGQRQPASALFSNWAPASASVTV